MTREIKDLTQLIDNNYYSFTGYFKILPKGRFHELSFSVQGIKWAMIDDKNNISYGYIKRYDFFDWITYLKYENTK